MVPFFANLKSVGKSLTPSCGMAEIILSNFPSLAFLMSPLIRATFLTLLSLIFSCAYLCAIGLASTPVISFAFEYFARMSGYGAMPDPATRIFSPFLACCAMRSLSEPSLGE